MSIYLVLFTSVPSFEHTHTPSLSCLAPVRQPTTQPPNERNKNGPLKSLETFMSSKKKKKKNIQHKKAHFHSWLSHTNYAATFPYATTVEHFISKQSRAPARLCRLSSLNEKRVFLGSCLVCSPETRPAQSVGHVWVLHTHTLVSIATTARHGCPTGPAAVHGSG